MACQAPNTIGSDGKCYSPCGPGQVPWGNSNVQCIQQCPPEFLQAENQCVRPSLPRDLKPPLQCPPGATRIGEQCWLACPDGTVENQEVCEPACPDGFVESEDGLACEAEFVKRVASLRNACFPNEERIGNFCLQKCPSGMEPQANEPSLCTYSLPDNVKKQFVTNNLTSAKIIFGRTRVDAECLVNYTPAPKGCYSLCPLNSEAQGDSCVINCPAGFTQQNSSCGRKIVSRNQASGSVSTGTFLFLLAVGGFVVLFIIIGLVKGTKPKSS